MAVSRNFLISWMGILLRNRSGTCSFCPLNGSKFVIGRLLDFQTFASSGAVTLTVMATFQRPFHTFHRFKSSSSILVNCSQFWLVDPRNPWEALCEVLVLLGLEEKTTHFYRLTNWLSWNEPRGLGLDDHYGMYPRKNLQKALATAALQLNDCSARHPQISFNWDSAHWRDGGGFYLKLANCHKKYFSCGMEKPGNH